MGKKREKGEVSAKAGLETDDSHDWYTATLYLAETGKSRLILEGSGPPLHYTARAAVSQNTAGPAWRGGGGVGGPPLRSVLARPPCCLA